VGSVRQEEQVLENLARAHSAGALVVHTLVDESLRDLLLLKAEQLGVATVDLTGPLFDWLTPMLVNGGQPSQAVPPAYRQY
jgi:regulator of PEP synthase PpsR (kinase-PPPase family)